LRDILWHPPHFVAIGDAGRILTSPDGITWTRRASGSSFALTTLSSSGTLLVAAGDAGTVVTSPDGIDWTSRSLGTRKAVISSVRSDNRFLLSTLDSLYTSMDGMTWSPGPRHTDFFLDLAWSGSRFVGLAYSGRILASTDGLSWTTRYDQSNTTKRAIAWSGQRFVVCGDKGILLTSPDGLTWTREPAENSPPTEHPLHEILWTGKQFIVAGEAGAILTSAPEPVSARSRAKLRGEIAWAWVANRLEVTLPPEWVGKRVRVTAYDSTGRVIRRKTLMGAPKVYLAWRLQSVASLNLKAVLLD
jgi:hypothetical protein